MYYDICHELRVPADTMSGYRLAGFRWIERVFASRRSQAYRAYGDRHPAPEGWTLHFREAAEEGLRQEWLNGGGTGFDGAAFEAFGDLMDAMDTVDVAVCREALGVLADLAEELGVHSTLVERTRVLLGEPTLAELSTVQK